MYSRFKIRCHVAQYESQVTHSLLKYCNIDIFYTGQESRSFSMKEDTVGGENNKIEFLYRGQSYKKDSESLESCAETYALKIT